MRYSVALTSVMMWGGSLANLLFNVRKGVAHNGARLIDWDLILVMEPTTIVGAILGGYMNKVTCAQAWATVKWHYDTSAKRPAASDARVKLDASCPAAASHERPCRCCRPG